MKKEYVWDIFVRAFHWALVICVIANFFVREDSLEHMWIGYTAVGLIAARLLWGIIGTKYARFANWFPTPGRLYRYVTKKDPEPLGHNPVGALMMLTLMALILILGYTGYTMYLPGFDDDAQEWVEELHEGAANAVLILGGIHGLVALFKRQISGMITGWKPVK